MRERERRKKKQDGGKKKMKKDNDMWHGNRRPVIGVEERDQWKMVRGGRRQKQERPLSVYESDIIKSITWYAEFNVINESISLRTKNRKAKLMLYL